ncbi:hypothetical protein V6Z12_A07G185100 [Gossypium hirsutum]
MTNKLHKNQNKENSRSNQTSKERNSFPPFFKLSLLNQFSSLGLPIVVLGSTDEYCFPSRCPLIKSRPFDGVVKFQGCYCER